MGKIPIWIDCDTEAKHKAALFMAHQIDTLEILGMSTAGSAITLNQSSEKEAALAALYHAAKEQAGNLEVIALGPLTNLAASLNKYPELTKLIKRILFVGGAAVGGNVTPCAEFNIYTDPEAAQTVFLSGIPLVMCGLDVTQKIHLTPEEIEELTSHSAKITNLPGIGLSDACPFLYLTNPEYFSGQEAGVFVETRGTITLGKTVTDLYSDYKFEKKNTTVLLEVDRTAFVKKIFDILLSY